VEDFTLSGLKPILLDNVKKTNYTKPTPIQKYAIPIIKNKRDLMACAQTGSGKTVRRLLYQFYQDHSPLYFQAAFLLPIMHTLLSEPTPLTVSASGAIQPQCIILSPTRELARQLYTEGLKFSCTTILRLGLVYGGTGTNNQISKIAVNIFI